MKFFDLEGVKSLIPHRDPFLKIDQASVTGETIEDGAIECTFFVRENDPVFAGHYPGAPVYPGVLTLESMAQAGAILARVIGGEGRGLPLLARIEEARFRGPVFPGDRLIIKAKIQGQKGPLWRLETEAEAEGKDRSRRKVATALIVAVAGGKA